MIFVTVGHADPFDRLVQAIDRWMQERTLSEPVLAQIGNGNYLPKRFDYVRFMTPVEFRKAFGQSRLVVAHAGMGSIITAMEMQKSIVLMPKRASLGEQRNEHQLATIRYFQKYSRIRIAENEEDLPDILDDILSDDHGNSVAHPMLNDDMSSWAPDPTLIDFVNDFVSAERS